MRIGVGRRFILFFFLFLLIAFGTVSSFLLFTLANYSDTVEKVVSKIKTDQPTETKKELIKLHYFYDLSKELKIQWLADKYLFQDAFFYESGDNYNIGDWQKVIDGLKDKQDDPRSYLYGNAKFRRAQVRYQAGETKEALDEVLGEVASDFEKALRVCLETYTSDNQCFDRVWNYDLATNKKDAEEALKNPQKGPRARYMLGPIKEKGEVPSYKDKDKGSGNEGDEGGRGSPRRRP